MKMHLHMKEGVAGAPSGPKPIQVTVYVKQPDDMSPDLKKASRFRAGKARAAATEVKEKQQPSIEHAMKKATARLNGKSRANSKAHVAAVTRTPESCVE